MDELELLTSINDQLTQLNEYAATAQDVFLLVGGILVFFLVVVILVFAYKFFNMFF